jgi:hypothetical protein
MKSRKHLNFDFAAIILAVMVIFALVTNCSDSEPPEKTGLPQKSHSWNTESKLRPERFEFIGASTQTARFNNFLRGVKNAKNMDL